MALLSPNIYDHIAHFHNATDPLIKWSVTNTFYSATTPADGDAIISALRTFLPKTAHSDAVYSSDAVYAWSRGASVYPAGLPIFTRVFGTACQADITTWPHLNTTYAPVGGEVCMVIVKTPHGRSRPGRNFFRDFYGEDDLNAVPGGNWLTVQSLANFQADLNTRLVTDGMSAFITSSPPGPYFVIQPYSKKHGTVGTPVPILSFVFNGVTTAKRTRRNKR